MDYDSKTKTMTATVIQPSTLLPDGLQTQQINKLTRFKFTPQLGERMQTLLDKQKDGTLTPEERLELAAIGELDDIFSDANALLTAQPAQP